MIPLLAFEQFTGMISVEYERRAERKRMDEKERQEREKYRSEAQQTLIKELADMDIDGVDAEIIAATIDYDLNKIKSMDFHRKETFNVGLTIKAIAHSVIHESYDIKNFLMEQLEQNNKENKQIWEIMNMTTDAIDEANGVRYELKLD
jgi:hypothetical protein